MRRLPEVLHPETAWIAPHASTDEDTSEIAIWTAGAGHNSIDKQRDALSCEDNTRFLTDTVFQEVRGNAVRGPPMLQLPPQLYAESTTDTATGDIWEGQSEIVPQARRPAVCKPEMPSGRR